MAIQGAVDDGWLERRRAFCLGRIEARLNANREVGLSLSDEMIVAGLHREMAAIGLLSGATNEAMAHFAKAGSLFLNQGFAHGLLLLALADEPDVLEHPLARGIIDAAMMLDTPGDGEAKGASFRSADLYSPYQWLAVIQASAIVAEREEAVAERDEGVDVLVSRLRPQASIALPNGLPLGLYLDLLAPRETTKAVPKPGAGLDYVLGWRRRLIAIAMEDRHHWELSLDPVSLIDLDLLALFLARPILQEVTSGLSPEDLIHDGNLELLPLSLAIRLRMQRPALRG